MEDMDGITHGYSYFPILIDQKEYGKSRDEVYEILKENNIFARRYFYPLISSFEPYRELPSATAANLPVATTAADEVLCLPIFVELENEQVRYITELILK